MFLSEKTHVLNINVGSAYTMQTKLFVVLVKNTVVLHVLNHTHAKLCNISQTRKLLCGLFSKLDIFKEMAFYLKHFNLYKFKKKLK
jgi:hypothetical protein